MTTVHPVRLQLSRRRGFDLQRLSIATNGLPAKNCARPSILGNPFPVSVYGHAGAVDRFKRWLYGRMSMSEMASSFRQDRLAAIPSREVGLATVREWLIEELHKARDHNFACWCALPRPDQSDLCHAAIELDYIRGEQKVMSR